MASEKVETVIAGNYVEMEREEGDSSKPTKGKLSTLFWHGGSVYDAWFSCASNQAKILLPHFPFSIFISYPFCYYYFSFLVSDVFSDSGFVSFPWFFTGCSSASYTSIFIFTTGDAFWDSLPTLLWSNGKLDCVSY